MASLAPRDDDRELISLHDKDPFEYTTPSFAEKHGSVKEMKSPPMTANDKGREQELVPQLPGQKQQKDEDDFFPGSAGDGPKWDTEKDAAEGGPPSATPIHHLVVPHTNGLSSKPEHDTAASMPDGAMDSDSGMEQAAPEKKPPIGGVGLAGLKPGDHTLSSPTAVLDAPAEGPLFDKAGPHPQSPPQEEEPLHGTAVSSTFSPTGGSTPKDGATPKGGLTPKGTRSPKGTTSPNGVDTSGPPDLPEAVRLAQARKKRLSEGFVDPLERKISNGTPTYQTTSPSLASLDIPRTPKPLYLQTNALPRQQIDLKHLPGKDVLPYKTLRGLRPEDGVDMTCKELYLSQDEFLEVFGKDQAAFAKLPKWRQTLAKKDVGLF